MQDLTRPIGLLFPSLSERMTADQMSMLADALEAIDLGSGVIFIDCPCCRCEFDAEGFAGHVASPPEWCDRIGWGLIDFEDDVRIGRLMTEWHQGGHVARVVDGAEAVVPRYIEVCHREGRRRILAVLDTAEVVELQAEQAAALLLCG